MEMHQIRYFLAVADTLHFTRAAEKCNVAQPSLTRAIRKLEGELGAPLFERNPNGTQLTELGRLIRPYLEQSYSLAAAAKGEATSFGKKKKRRLKLGVMCTIGPARLVELIHKLEAQIPNLELSIQEQTGGELIEHMMNGSYDAALVGMPSYPDKLRVDPLYQERYVVSFPPGHRFESMESVPVSELNGETYLARTNCEYPEFFQDRAGTWPFEFDVRYRSEREDWIQAMVLSGLGCSIMPEYMPLVPGLKTRVLVEPALYREIGLATVRGKKFSPVLESFVRLTQAHRW